MTLLTIAGWMFTAAVILLVVADTVPSVRQAAGAIEANAALGIPADMVRTIGAIGLACTLLYAIPQTAMLGAVLLTGFFGGAVMTHLRVESAAWDIGENVAAGILAWAGLWLRDERLRALLPVRRRSRLETDRAGF